MAPRGMDTVIGLQNQNDACRGLECVKNIKRNEMNQHILVKEKLTIIRVAVQYKSLYYE
jgi:hypothetical protein